jgi:hypothetical protein
MILTGFTAKLLLGNPIQKLLNITLVLLLLMNVSACQLLFQETENSKDEIIDETTYGHYYLWIKSLSDDELTQEVELQKQRHLQEDSSAEVNLLLLHSLPNSPIHNPYTAKAKLNQQIFQQYIESTFSVADLAFIIMLKDQLNQQLLLLRKLIAQENKAEQNHEKLTKLQLEKIALNEKVMQLEKQIIQLKKIEQAISEHGQ